jgi:hypothetical protein
MANNNKIKTPRVSKGQRDNVSSARRSGAKLLNTKFDRALNKQKAYENGHNPMITVPNPDPMQKNKLFIRVPARSIYGDPRKRDWIIIK